MNEVQEKQQSDLVRQVKEAARQTREEKKLFRTNPEEASRRVKSRVDHVLRMAMAERVAERFAAYEGAENDRLRGEKWLASKLSSNDQLSTELETLIDRSLDLYRNDCYASSAINGRVDNVVGTGIRPQSRVQPERGILTPAQAEDFNVMAEWLFSRWAKIERFYSKQRQLERCNGLFGEHWLEMADDDNPLKPVTLTVQVIAPQRIPVVGYGSIKPGQRRRLGLRLDQQGFPVSAYVRKSHPNDSEAYDQGEDEKDLGTQILHSYEELFPGQLRGVPWLSPAMGRLKDLKDFVYANLVAEQVAACHSAFITGVTDPVVLAEQGRSRSNLEDLSPGTIQYLADGEGVAFSDPARPGTTLAPYVEWALHGVAAALRYPYELLAKQFTNNFSGGRLALMDGRITFKVWQQCLIERTLEPVWHRFIDQCVFEGAIKIDPVKYEENRDHFLQHAWIPPGWPWVDPEKEVTADLAAIAGGLQTETESLAARGRDFDETLAQREREAMAKMKSEARIMTARQALGLPDPNAIPAPVGKPSESAKAVRGVQNATA
jgi:lambda family phage portal protein